MWAGIDIGSLSAEAVIINREKIFSYAIVPTGVDSVKNRRRSNRKSYFIS